MAKQSIYTFGASATSAQFSFGPEHEDIVVRFDDLTPEIKHALMVHGLKQKIADGAAIPRNTDTGRSASVEDKVRAMRAIAERLQAGEWRASGEGSGAPVGGLLLRALVRLYPAKAREELETYLAGKNDKEKAALRGNPKIAAAIAEIKAEDAAKKPGVDTDAMLDELEG